MPEFFQTPMGKGFYDGTMRKVALSLEDIAQNATKSNELKERELAFKEQELELKRLELDLKKKELKLKEKELELKSQEKISLGKEQ